MEVRADQYSNDDNHNFRDASFSYLREENLNQKMKNKNSSDHHQEEGEICVFGAERYFNTALEDTKTSNRINKNNNHLNTINRRSSSITMENDIDHIPQYGGGERSLAPGTPSAYSEAIYKIEDSSYNLDSDASSDLFEIENITAATRSPELLQPPAQATSSVLVLKPASRQVLLGKNDNMSLHMTPNYNSDQYYSSYEPSEASIDWSVVTASAAAADQMMSSAVFGYDEKKLTASSSMNTSRATAGRGGVKYYKAARRSGSGGGSSGGFKGGRSRHNNGILGCKSHKAVRVAETVHTNDSRSN
uniref:Uncharacterized protein n=1 Tax=Cannabis sativa TaxID=3483 RepID=A0A803P4K1_CANSA